eukprot:Skav200591  [mRNA]  locus=scaffold2706:31252:36046:+ [translate_table: standard]
MTPPPETVKVFKRHDANADGKLALEELQAVMKGFGGFVGSVPSPFPLAFYLSGWATAIRGLLRRPWHFGGCTTWSSCSTCSSGLVGTVQSATQRRAARRGRANARRDWYLHKRGIKPLPGSRLKAILHRLKSHHSRDQPFLQRIQSDMATQEGWWCAKCRQPKSASAHFCGQCGMSWEKSEKMRRNQASQYRTDAPRWTYWGQPVEQWEANTPRQGKEARSKSPRQRNQQHPKPQGGKGKQKHGNPGHGGKGKGLGKEDGGKMKQPGKKQGKGDGGEPTWKSGKTGPQPSDPAPPPPLPAPAEPSASDAQLKHVMAMLKKNQEHLPAEVQNLVHTTDLQTSRSNIKALHAAASRLGSAKKKVQQARNARIGLHSAWKEYLQNACIRWERFIQEFTQDDTALEKDLQQAFGELQEAKQHLDQVRETVQAEDLESENADDDMAEFQDKPVSAVSIREGMAGMKSSIESLRRQAEESLDAMQSAIKRHKPDKAAVVEVDPPNLAAEVPPASGVGGARSLEPFASAGHQSA